MPQVNYKYSVRTRLLIYKLGIGAVANGLLTVYAFSVSTGLATFVAVSEFKQHHYVLILPCGLFDIWMILNITLMNALVKIEGVTINFFESAIKPANPKFRFRKIAEGIYGYKREVSFTSGGFGAKWTLLKHEEVLYLNKITLVKGDVWSPFQGLYNYIKCRKIAKRLQELKLEKAQSNHSSVAE